MFHGLLLPSEALGAESPRAAEPPAEGPVYRSEGFAEDLPPAAAPAPADTLRSAEPLARWWPVVRLAFTSRTR